MRIPLYQKPPLTCGTVHRPVTPNNRNKAGLKKSIMEQSMYHGGDSVCMQDTAHWMDNVSIYIVA